MFKYVEIIVASWIGATDDWHPLTYILADIAQGGVSGHKVANNVNIVF